MPRNALGRGLGALIREPEASATTPANPPTAAVVITGGGAAAPAPRWCQRRGPGVRCLARKKSIST